MKVKFKRQFFAPKGRRYRKDEWYDVPDEWGDKLPEGTAIMDPDGELRTIPKKPRPTSRTILTPKRMLVSE